MCAACCPHLCAQNITSDIMDHLSASSSEIFKSFIEFVTKVSQNDLVSIVFRGLDRMWTRPRTSICPAHNYLCKLKRHRRRFEFYVSALKIIGHEKYTLHSPRDSVYEGFIHLRGPLTPTVLKSTAQGSTIV